MTPIELEQIGRTAAEFAAGATAVEDIDVLAGEDGQERPVYYFSFLIDQARARQRAGLVRTRLTQKLRDELLARGDSRLPVVRILSPDDWSKRVVD